MAGVPKSIRIKGIGFVFPSDCSPSVYSAASRQYTESTVFSDGSSEPMESVLTPKITGLQVKCKPSDWNKLKDLACKRNLPVVYETVDRVCEFTGYIVCSDGLSYDSAKGITNEFEVHSEDGKMNDTATS